MSPILYRLFMVALPVSHDLPAIGTRLGHNGIFGVKLKPPEACPYYAGVRFQEVVEAAFSRMLYFVIYPIFAIGGYLLTGSPFAFAVALLLTVMVRLIPARQRQLEYRGQSVESYIRATYYGETQDVADYNNAKQLALGSSYRRGFRDMYVADVEAKLHQWRPWAKRMCESRWLKPQIERWVATSSAAGK